MQEVSIKGNELGDEGVKLLCEALKDRKGGACPLLTALLFTSYVLGRCSLLRMAAPLVSHACLALYAAWLACCCLGAPPTRWPATIPAGPSAVLMWQHPLSVSSAAACGLEQEMMDGPRWVPGFQHKCWLSQLLPSHNSHVDPLRLVLHLFP